jgi:FkbM family methyltransferase
MIVPFFAVAFPLWIRAALWGPLIVESTTEDGIRIRCRLQDGIQIYIYLFGTAWEPDLAAFLRRRIRPGDTVIDVGAHIGCVTALTSKLVGPGGTVVAIEPCPLVIPWLHETVERNELTNVRVVDAAVSDRDHELPLFLGPNWNPGETTTVARPKLREQGRVRAAPLDSLLTREELTTARAIKIDVEGGEDRVLAGMLASLDALAADAELVVELSPSWWSDPELRPIDVLQPFLERGFHVYLLPNDYFPWRYLWPRDVGVPQRLRDLTELEERVFRLDVVLSRTDADTL